MKLHIDKPIINTFPEHSHILSIVHQNRNAYKWIYNNYIQLGYRKFRDIPIVSNPIFLPQDYYENCPFIECERLKRDKINIVEMIKQKIDKGVFIIISVDGFFISRSFSFRKYHMNHPMLIWGYDEQEEVLFTSDFYQDGYYTNELIPIDEFIMGYASKEDKWIQKDDPYLDILIMNLDARQDYKFDVDWMKKQLFDYFSSQNLCDLEVKTWNSNNLSSFLAYGLKSFSYLKKDLEYIRKERLNIPFHFFSIPYEQKRLMQKRLIYLKDEKIVPEKEIEKIYINFLELIRSSENMKLLSLKYNMTKDNRILTKLIKKLTTDVEKEYNWYKRLLLLL